MDPKKLYIEFNDPIKHTVAINICRANREKVSLCVCDNVRGRERKEEEEEEEERNL
jgi:hypothetical protein